MTPNRKWILATSIAAVLLSGCESGDINLSPSTNVTNPPASGGGGDDDNPCASYVNDSSTTVQGTYDGTNCTYSSSFVDSGNNLMFDLTIPALTDGGAHIFEGSLFVGGAYENAAELQAAGIAQGGDGPTLTIEAGAILAFASQNEFMVINRGSQIIADGTADAPITITSVSDVNGDVGAEDVQQWGGLVIDGFGVTNKCVYTGSVATDDLALDGECSLPAEGSAGLDENYYGGDNNDDNSGILRYVVVKHTGAEVANGDELNGITFAGVGRGTTVENLEVYSVYDDGIEFFGGAVDVANYLAMYVRDDSIDIDEGYSGTITNALVVQSAADGNHCIESDGIGSYSTLATENAARIQQIIDQGINSRPTINNLTCILSGHGAGTHDPSAGWRLREGIFATINDSLMIASFQPNDEGSATDNYCLRMESTETRQGALDGDVQLNSVIFACAERTHNADPFPDGTTTEESFVVDGGNVWATIPSGTAVNPTAGADADLQLLEGAQPVYSIDWATSQVDGAAPAATTEPTEGTFLGGLSQSVTDWTQGWTYGLHPDNRAQDLWFE